MGKTFHISGDDTLLIQDRAQFHIDVFGPARCVMNVQDPIRTAHLPGLFHRAVLTGLVTRHIVVVGNPITLMANERLVGAAELTQVSRVCRQDVVIGIEDDHRLGLVLQKRDQGLHLVWMRKQVLGGRQAVCHRGSSDSSSKVDTATMPTNAANGSSIVWTSEETLSAPMNLNQ
ncbi:Hypothetical protein PSEBR_m824 [Pseudomonas brassicacearum subsp. brassicacearum NFM421]|uniref:Uncharacterized protein n=1 Tax=Pseudomonas brassicacearum (strain NFM421) TaxID=994484 RepID=F2KH24_PSEBN|nr:Hypothetical protein PSEBR_m824 [Pseudomonas brassicacearum subsp. brassicacearum NFM421]